MSEKKGRASILAAISDWRRLIALVASCGEAICIFMIQSTTQENLKLIAYIIGIIFLLVIIILIFVVILYKPKPPTIKKPIGQDKVPPLEGNCFIGIDIGRRKIDYCLLCYDKFMKEEQEVFTKDSPINFKDIYDELIKIIGELSQLAGEKSIHSIDGIGIGLPGQVNPRDGVFKKSPGNINITNEPIVDKFFRRIRKQQKECSSKYNPINDKIPIRLDNDVRCATRYLWKVHNYQDIICIFSGMGLGSGIVLGGRMLYGYNFSAGEIGHTTISENCQFIGSEKCMCEKEGCHWEMFASRKGVERIADYIKRKEPEKYKKFRGKYKDEKDFKKLSTPFLSRVFYEGDEYVCEIVKIFIKYLAIGVANYLNIINPASIYLGGGMIEAFYNDKKESPSLGYPTSKLFEDEKNKYALDSVRDVIVLTGEYEEKKIAALGAALIFKDQSYLDYISGM